MLILLTCLYLTTFTGSSENRTKLYRGCFREREREEVKAKLQSCDIQHETWEPAGPPSMQTGRFKEEAAGVLGGGGLTRQMP